jgi:hypothetical protein
MLPKKDRRRDACGRTETSMLRQHTGLSGSGKLMMASCDAPLATEDGHERSSSSILLRAARPSNQIRIPRNPECLFAALNRHPPDRVNALRGERSSLPAARAPAGRRKRPVTAPIIGGGDMGGDGERRSSRVRMRSWGRPKPVRIGVRRRS